MTGGHITPFGATGAAGINTPAASFRADYEFALGDMRGIRCWKPVETTTGIVLQSLYHAYQWKPGQNDAVCGSGRPLVRTKDCVQGRHSHPTNMGFLTTCYAEHEPGIDAWHACGFYAYTREENDNPYVNSHHVTVEGIIQGYGRCIVGTKGFRASKARILALILPPHVRAQMDLASQSKSTVLGQRADAALRKAYPDVPVFDSRDTMLTEFPLTPLGVDE